MASLGPNPVQGPYWDIGLSLNKGGSSRVPAAPHPSSSGHERPQRAKGETRFHPRPMELPSAPLADPAVSLRQTRPVSSPGPAGLLNGLGSCLPLRLNKHEGHQVRGAQVPRTRVCLIPAAGWEQLCQGTEEPGGSDRWPRVLTARRSSHGTLCCVMPPPQGSFPSQRGPVLPQAPQPAPGPAPERPLPPHPPCPPKDRKRTWPS